MRPWHASLRAKLFASYVFAIAVAVVTLLLAGAAISPIFFAAPMGRMMDGSGMGGMMGQSGTSMPALTPELVAALRAALLETLVLATVLTTVVALVVSLAVSHQIVRPIQRMRDATRRIAAGHYAERVPVQPADGRDEIGQLTASFNAMAEALEQAETRRRELIGDVAHELRTPISTLEGYLEGLLDEVVEPSPATWAKLHDEAGRLRRLADDLHELSRAEARQIPLVVRAVPPATVVQVVVDRLATTFVEKGLALQSTVDPGLPMVAADPDRAGQVLTNLLVNALRYTPAPGRVVVGAERADQAVVFRVTDTGVGVAPRHVPHLFDRFYRVDKSRSRAQGGSGIGLTIAQALVEAMGGRIWAESAGVGQGSTFSFTLPLAR